MDKCGYWAIGDQKSCMVASALPQEGKSVLALTLARNAAAAGWRVLLLECDFGCPTLAAQLRVKPMAGLSDILGGTMLGERRDVINEFEPRLHVITAGNTKGNSQELLASFRMSELLSTLRTKYDLVLLDTPPVLAAADALVLARQVDTTMLVVRWEKTTRSATQDAVRLLYASRARIMGAVMTKSTGGLRLFQAAACPTHSVVTTVIIPFSPDDRRPFIYRRRNRRSVMQPVYINGRFLTQPLTGVQRFSAEVTAAIDRLSANGQWPKTVLLAPRGNRTINGTKDRYRCLQFQEVGRTQGHLWEQTELPAAARDGVLVSLGNTGPMLLGRRQVVVIHDAGVFDTPGSYSFRFRTWYKILQSVLVRAGTHIVTVSEFSRNRIANRLGVDPVGIDVMYEGADHILRATADRGVLDRHNLPPQRFVLVVGSRVEHKNLTVLDHVATALQPQGVLIAVAGGRDNGVYRDTQGAGAGVRQLGRVTDNELRALYENALCLLFPSQYEGFGLPPVEAMTCGCPVVASAGGAVEEICGDGILYFDTENDRTIVSMIKRLLDEHGLADNLRRRGYLRAAGMNWEASACLLRDVVQNVRL